MDNHYKYIRQILILTLILFPKLSLIFIGLMTYLWLF
jgi:nitrate reductase NapE component